MKKFLNIENYNNGICRSAGFLAKTIKSSKKKILIIVFY
jgi:hypothetical protein